MQENLVLITRYFVTLRDRSYVYKSDHLGQIGMQVINRK